MIYLFTQLIEGHSDARSEYAALFPCGMAAVSDVDEQHSVLARNFAR